MSRDNIIYIGRKPAMSYVMATLATFKDNESVLLKARGRAISTAVDVAEITRNRYLTKMLKPEIAISTDKVEGDRGPRNVSSMTITLNKGESEIPEGILRPRRRSRKRREPKKESPPEPEPVVEAPPIDVSKIEDIEEEDIEKLRSAGFDTVNKVADADSFGLSLKTGLSEDKIQRIIDNAKKL